MFNLLLDIILSILNTKWLLVTGYPNSVAIFGPLYQYNLQVFNIKIPKIQYKR